MPIFKKKFRDTALSKFLKEKAPHILDKVVESAGNRFPAIGFITDLISKDDKLTPEEKAAALEMAKIELDQEKERTSRWVSDMQSDSWLSKNARPLVLLSSVAYLFTVMILDSCQIEFEVKDIWINLYGTMIETVIGGYFVIRGAEKISGMLKKK